MKRIMTDMARKVCNIFRGTAKANETKRANTENEKTSDKQAVIDQVRMVYEKLKQGGIKSQRNSLLLHEFEYQIYQLEHLKDPFGFTNSIKKCANYYASWPSEERTPNVTVSELEETDKMVEAFWEYFCIRRHSSTSVGMTIWVCACGRNDI